MKLSGLYQVLCFILYLSCTSFVMASQVIVYYDGDGEAIKIAAKIYGEQAAVDVRIKHGKPEELFNKLKEDGEGAQADIYISKHAAFMEMGREQGLFQKATSPSGLMKGEIEESLKRMHFADQRIADELFDQLPGLTDFTQGLPIRFRAEDDTWLGLASSARVLLVSTGSSEAYDLKSVFELADPKWKGRIAMTSFYDEDTLSAIATYRQLLGDKKVENWLLGLKDNLEGKVYEDANAAVKALNTGKKEVAWVNHNYRKIDLNRSVSSAKVDMVLADSDEKGAGLPWNITGAAILKSSQNAFDAQGFIAFLLSEEGQEAFIGVDSLFSINNIVPPDPNMTFGHVFKEADVPLKLYGVRRGDTIDMLKTLDMP